MIVVDSYKELLNIPSPQEGDQALINVRDNLQKLYSFDGKEWKSVSNKVPLGVSLYELNKQIISQMPEVDWSTENFKDLFFDYITTTGHTYYMLLCNDAKYYTLFHKNEYAEAPIEDEIIDILKNCGYPIKGIARTEDGAAIEIWFDDMVGYLFGYDQGVVECK